MPKKSLGQNFLIDRSVIADLLDAAQLSPDDIALEIGTGTGNITKELAKRVAKVFAVEIDPDLIPQLKKNTGELGNVEIINSDILNLPPTTYHLQAILGAIPYQITSPLIHKMIFESWPQATFIVQKEVAEKICAKPPHASYLSNFVEAFAEAKIVRHVPPTAFNPQPKVWSSIITIIPTSLLPTSLLPTSLPPDPFRFSRFLHLGFQSPRKMLNKVFSKELLLSLGIEPTLRPENLTLEQWLKLYKYLNLNVETGHAPSLH